MSKIKRLTGTSQETAVFKYWHSARKIENQETCASAQIFGTPKRQFSGIAATDKRLQLPYLDNLCRNVGSLFNQEDA